jgi:hypothetical protein
MTTTRDRDAADDAGGTLSGTLPVTSIDASGSAIVPRASKRSSSTPSLPALTPALERLRSFYRLATLPDGFPGRRENDGSITPHPIYGTYVLLDYTKQFAAHPTNELRDAIGLVAHAAVERMEAIEDGLAFYYEHAGHSISRQPNRHYSGLTQAYYAVALYRAFAATRDETLRDAAARSFRSLLVPESRGGVLYRWRGGVALAEVPTRPRDLILNGWLSILHSVREYADLSGDRTAAALLVRSARTLARLLPLYDAPELANSRYSLTGPVYVRLRFGARIDGVVISRLRVAIPHEGEFSVPVERGSSRWQNYLTHPAQDAAATKGEPLALRRTGLRLNIVVSRLGHPEPNRITFTIVSPRAMRIRLEAYVGRYDPSTSAPVERSWESGDTVTVPAGRSRVELALPPKLVDLVAYPTNFIKEIEGHPTNVYHMIHIKRLRELHAATEVPQLAEWADRWEDYVLRWNRMPRYRGLHVRNYFTDIPNPSVDLTTFRRRVLKERSDGTER